MVKIFEGLRIAEGSAFAAPPPGENTDEILCEIGYSDGEIAGLRDDGEVTGGR